jgi:protease I
MMNAGAEVEDADVIVDHNMVTCSYYGAVGPFMQTVIALCGERTRLAAC